MRFAPLLAYEPTAQVQEAASRARDAIDELLRLPEIFRPGPAIEVYAPLLAHAELHADAFLEGIDIPEAVLFDELSKETPIGVRLRAIAAVHSRVEIDARTFSQTPPRVLGAWHLALGSLSEGDSDSRGRPRVRDEAVVDVLHTGVDASEPGDAVRAIIDVVTGAGRDLPAIVAAGLLHAILATAMPFPHANGVLARCSAKSLLMSRGTDPSGRLALVTAMADAGRPAYVQMIRSSAAFTTTSLDESVMWFCQVVIAGSRRSQLLVEKVQKQISAG